MADLDLNLESVTLLDIQNNIKLMCTKIDTLQTTCEQKDKKIEELLKVIKDKDVQINNLEERVSDLENLTNESKRYSLKDNIIIKGLKVTFDQRQASYSSVASSNQAEDASSSPEGLNPRSSAALKFRITRKQVTEFINLKMNVPIEEEEISAAHELPKGPRDTVAPIVVRFVYTSTKQDVMAARRNLRGSQTPVYFNDQLTAMNGKIFSKARQMFKQGVLAGCWTRLGKIYVKRTETSSPTWIQSIAQL